MLSFNEVHMTKENTNILGLVWIKGKWRGVKGSGVELVENRLILGQRSLNSPSFQMDHYFSTIFW